jgi:transcriptional regulator with XRE-family HTH domain
LNRVEFGKLVVALRRGIRDDEDRSWSQKRLGEQTELGEATIGKIERGERVNLDPDTLPRLANAMHLTTVERREFFIAAIGVDNYQMTRPEMSSEKVLEDMVHVIEQVRLPALIVDSYGDLVAANSALAQILEIPSEFVANAHAEPASFNLMRIIFAPEFGNVRNIFGVQWTKTAVYNIEFFRYTTLRYRFTDYFLQTLRQLRKYPLFRQYWHQFGSQQEDNYFNSERCSYEHPKHGAVHYLTTLSTALTTSGELYFVTYVPANARTAEVFAGLADHGDKAALRLASWPEKRLA